jgi:hypothetical protein
MENEINFKEQAKQSIEKSKVTQLQEVESLPDGTIISQVEIAKKYPRDLARCLANAMKVFDIDPEFAEKVRYKKPQAGTSIEGPSVHLAKLIAQVYGNLRVDARVSYETDKKVVSEAIAWDLESNTAIRQEIHQSVWSTKNNKRYSDDMVVTASLSANAKALRNAIFAVIPRYFVDRMIQKADEVLETNYKDQAKFEKRKSEMFAYFLKENILPAQIYAYLGISTDSQITIEKLKELIKVVQSIKDGDAKANEIFKPINKSNE